MVAAYWAYKASPSFRHRTTCRARVRARIMHRQIAIALALGLAHRPMLIARFTRLVISIDQVLD